MRNKNPLKAANDSAASTVADENAKLRKRRKSSSGSAWRDSHTTSVTAQARAVPKPAMIVHDDQPSRRPSMTAEVRASSPTMIRAWATRSSRRGRSARDSGTKRAVSQKATTAIGRLIQKIDRQPRLSTSAPPSIGPAAIDTPKTAPQTPMARARSLGSVKVLATIDIATGLSIEPPRACSMREPTSAFAVGARLHSSDPRLNTASPT